MLTKSVACANIVAARAILTVLLRPIAVPGIGPHNRELNTVIMSSASGYSESTLLNSGGNADSTSVLRSVSEIYSELTGINDHKSTTACGFPLSKNTRFISILAQTRTWRAFFTWLTGDALHGESCVLL